MNILNYLFIGFLFTFLLDIILNTYSDHPKVKYLEWGLKEKILSVLVWPVGLLVFLNSFFKSLFK